VLSALLDMVGVLALLPLMQLLTGQDRQEGALGAVTRLLGGNPSDAALALTIAAMMITAFVAKSAVSIGFRWWQLGFIAEQETRTAVRLLSGFLGAPYATYLRRGFGEFMRSLSDALSMTYSSMVVAGLAVVTELITLMGLSSLMIITSPPAAAAALLWFGLSTFALNRFLRRRTTVLGQQMVHQSLRSFHAAVHPLGGAREIMLRHNADIFVKELEEARRDATRTGLRQGFLGELPKHLLELIFVIGLAGTAVVIFTQTPSTQALVTLTLFAACGTRMMPSLVRLTAAMTNMRFGIPLTQLVIDDLHEFEHPLDPAPTSKLPSGDLHLEGVTFRYPGATRNALDGIDLNIPRGTSLAVVGPSGSGKSTMIDTILGLHEPSSGRVTVDGRDIRDDLAAWQTSLGVVPQDVWWVSDTLAANIAFGVPPDQRDLEAMARAVDRAQLRDVVAELPHGLDTILGEKGVRLSGGQRQRVGIARALYFEPTTLVFDEATSALDNATEHEVTATLQSLHGETTLIVVAHRLSTVRNCDHLIFVEGGRIAAQGTFDEVRAANAQFARLVELGNLDAADA
jgi:ABC-type multidrug transport system fused ATPase/permease subunit